MPIQGTILLVYHSSKIPQGLNNMCQDVQWGYHLFTIITHLITNIQRYKKIPCTQIKFEPQRNYSQGLAA